MARGSKKKDDTETEADAKTQAAASPHKDAVISQNKLVSLMKAKRAAKKETSETNGRIGQLIGDAVENNHLHRKAFAVIMTLDNMEPEKIADFLSHFNYYLDISGINKRAGQVMRMDLEGAAQEADAEAANVTKFPTAGNA